MLIFAFDRIKKENGRIEKFRIRPEISRRKLLIIRNKLLMTRISLKSNVHLDNTGQYYAYIPNKL